MAGPTPSTIKRLFALNGNLCAFPGCGLRVADSAGTIVADVCHIKGEKPKSARYDPKQSIQERHSYENLIVLCATHHRLVDGDATSYPVERLRSMKVEREKRAATQSPFIVSESAARRISDALFVGGVAGVAYGAAEAVHQIGPVFNRIIDAFLRAGTQDPRREALRYRRKLKQILRYGPTASVELGASDAGHEALGHALANLFENAGWSARVLPSQAAIAISKRIKRDQTKCLIVIALVRDAQQVPNAGRTLDEFYELLRFTRVPEGAQGAFHDFNGLRIISLVGARRTA